MSKIGDYVRIKRRDLGLTQEEFAIQSGLGLRFVRELEQGKKTVRMDKVNQALSFFGMEAVAGPISEASAPDILPSPVRAGKKRTSASSSSSAPTHTRRPPKNPPHPPQEEKEEEIWLL